MYTSLPQVIFCQIILFYCENIWNIVLQSEAKMSLYLGKREWELYSPNDICYGEMTNVMTTVIENDSCHDNCHNKGHQTNLPILINERQMTTTMILFCTWKICATGADGLEEINSVNP